MGVRSSTTATIITGRGQVEFWREDDEGGASNLWALWREDGWVVAHRLVASGERLTTGEVRVFPDEPSTVTEKLDVGGPRWSADRLGAVAAVPDRGVPSRLWRGANTRTRRRNLSQALRLARASHPELFAGLTESGPASRTEGGEAVGGS